jgi:hypothetical protein
MTMRCRVPSFDQRFFWRLLLIAILVLGASAARAGEHGGNGDRNSHCGGHKVTICHIPPGNPSNAHTITVDESALRAHFAHGDSPGACQSGGPCNPNPCQNLGTCSLDGLGGFSCQCISNGGLGETVGPVCECAPGCTSEPTGGCSCGSTG